MAKKAIRVERVKVEGGFGAEVYFDAATKLFYAWVNREKVEDAYLDKAREKVAKALRRTRNITFEQVIEITLPLRASRKEDEDDGSPGKRPHAWFGGYGRREPRAPDISTSMTFAFKRCERAPNPAKGRGKEKLERLHADDFEEYVATEVSDVSDRFADYSKTKEQRKKEHAERRAQKEAEVREARALYADTYEVSDERSYQAARYVMIPYSEEAWLGLRRIKQAMVATQDQLIALVRDGEARIKGLGAMPSVMLLVGARKRRK